MDLSASSLSTTVDFRSEIPALHFCIPKFNSDLAELKMCFTDKQTREQVKLSSSLSIEAGKIQRKAWAANWGLNGPMPEPVGYRPIPVTIDGESHRPWNI